MKRWFKKHFGKGDDPPDDDPIEKTKQALDELNRQSDRFQKAAQETMKAFEAFNDQLAQKKNPIPKIENGFKL